jgi:hypothetical protein
MSDVTVIAVEPFNGYARGAEVTVSDREAKQLIDKKLAKMKGPASNKMKVAPENKANPSPAAGRARTSSASPVARASAKKTATKSAAGARKRRTAAS